MDASLFSSDGLAYCNGAVAPLAEASVPLQDRGFLFGEAVYEVLIGYGKRFFATERHLDRMLRSANGISLPTEGLRERVEAAIEALGAQAPEGWVTLYLQVTGGTAPRAHLPPSPPPDPAVYAFLRPFDFERLDALRRSGASVVTCPDQRWRGATYKSNQILANVLATRRAHAQGAFEALLVRSGRILEGATSSFFLVRRGELLTPSPNQNVLNGITRDILIEECGGAEEVMVTRRMLLEADEAFLTSTVKMVLPIVSCDGQEIGEGAPGPVTRRAQERLMARVRDELGLAPRAL